MFPCRITVSFYYRYFELCLCILIGSAYDGNIHLWKKSFKTFKEQRVGSESVNILRLQMSFQHIDISAYIGSHIKENCIFRKKFSYPYQLWFYPSFQNVLQADIIQFLKTLFVIEERYIKFSASSYCTTILRNILTNKQNSFFFSNF